MKLFIPVAVCMLIGFSALGQDQFATTKGSENKFEDGKALTSKELIESITWSFEDSVMNIPAYTTYKTWNTTRVHPYDYNLTKMRDTIMIPLALDSCSFAPPFIGHKTSDFGNRRYRYHYGVDVKLLTGDPVASAFEGVVRVAHHDGDYGKVVVVRHNNGLETLYAHLSKFEVQKGDWVEAGDIIGLGGSTGRSTGSHLHFEARYLGEPINPNTLIDWEKGTLKSDTLMLSSSNFTYLKEIRAVKHHTIRSGDTLSGIARKYGTTVSALCQLNNMRTNTTLQVGKQLRYR